MKRKYVYNSIIPCKCTNKLIFIGKSQSLVKTQIIRIAPSWYISQNKNKLRGLEFNTSPLQYPYLLYLCT